MEALTKLCQIIPAARNGITRKYLELRTLTLAIFVVTHVQNTQKAKVKDLSQQVKTKADQHSLEAEVGNIQPPKWPRVTSNNK